MLKDVLTVVIGIALIAGFALLWVVGRLHEDDMYYTTHVVTRKKQKELERRTQDLEDMYAELQDALWQQQTDEIEARDTIDELLRTAESYRFRRK